MADAAVFSPIAEGVIGLAKPREKSR